MSITQTLLDILKYVLPAMIVLIAATSIVNRFIRAETQRRQIAVFEGAQDVTLRLRLQAYERLAMFIERLSPRQLIPRVYNGEMTVGDLHAALVLTIRSEFEHNLSQQIYVSKDVWDIVRGVKEQQLTMINRVSETLNPEAPARDLHARILELQARTDGDTPTDMALQLIHDEVKKVMQYGSY